MKLTNRDMVEQSLARIERWQAHYNAVNAALYAVREDMGQRAGEVNADNLARTLVDRELHEWRGLFMWALTLDDAEWDRIKAAAHERFLRDGMHVANWFHNGVSPGRWLAEDEEAFRAMAKKAFGPKGGDK